MAGCADMTVTPESLKAKGREARNQEHVLLFINNQKDLAAGKKKDLCLINKDVDFCRLDELHSCITG